MGPVGSGKTSAIRTISDIEVVDTDALATDGVAKMKSHTTVSMDVGTLVLGEKDKLRLYGTPGQDRFDFMWDILLDQSKGVLLLINHSAEEPLADLAHYLDALEKRRGNRVVPLVVCISHMDKAPERPFELYQDFFKSQRQMAVEDMPPVIAVDARSQADVRSALVAMTALLEMHERFPKHAARAA